MEKYRGGLLVSLAFLLFALDWIAIAKISVSREADRTVYNVEVEGLSTQQIQIGGGDYETLRLAGVGWHGAIHYRIGAPEVPVVRFYLEGSGPIFVRVQNQTRRAPSEFEVMPSQQSVVKLPNPPKQFRKDKRIYGLNTWYPNRSYSIEDAGMRRGQRQRLVTLYPVAYNPATREKLLKQSFTVIHRHGLLAKAPMQFSGEIFAFVVGEAYSQSSALAAYIELKEQQGYLVETIEVPAAARTPEQIRARLQELYRRPGNPLKYALLIGDHSDVPGKNAASINGVTDHYYRAIDTSSYSGDVNGPDIGVGRIAVSSVAELETVLSKYQRYQEGMFSDEAWLQEAAFLATSDRRFYRVAEGSHNYAIATHTEPADYRGNFPNPQEPGGDKLYAITHRAPQSRVMEALQGGRTIINYSGHGSTTAWLGPNVSKSDVRSISDPNALPFVISNACITGQFTRDSFAETWQRHENGAIMFWGSMDNTYWNEDDVLERSMYDGIFTDGKSTFAEITQYALLEHWRHYGGRGRSKYYWETYVTFGDPSIRLRTSRTRQATLTGPRQVPIGTRTITYQVLDAGGEGVADARVALAQQSGDFRLAAISDEAGIVELDVDLPIRQPTVFDLTVSGKNLRFLHTELSFQ